MEKRHLPEHVARKIYDILIDHCDASPRQVDQDQFTHAFCQDYHGAPREFRFGGRYGMAGKFWWSNDRFYVSGWSQGETNQRTYRKQLKHLEEVNQLLAAVLSEWILERNVPNRS